MSSLLTSVAEGDPSIRAPSINIVNDIRAGTLTKWTSAVPGVTAGVVRGLLDRNSEQVTAIIDARFGGREGKTYHVQYVFVQLISEVGLG